MKMKKDDYITEETKNLNEEYKRKVKVDRERAICRNIASKLSPERKQFLLEELSLELATKGENIK